MATTQDQANPGTGRGSGAHGMHPNPTGLLGDYDTYNYNDVGVSQYMPEGPLATSGGNGIVSSEFNTIMLNETIGPTNASVDLPFNFTTFTPLISLHYQLPLMIVVAVLLLMLTITTIFGNLLVGLSLIKYRQLRTVSNYLIGNLAISDFLLATTIIPLSAVYECLGHWVFGQAICYFWLCVDVLYCTASIWNLCIIAFDRFTATLYPVWYREKRNTRQAVIYIAIVWTFSFIICVPPLLGWNDLSTTYVYQNQTGVYQCMLFTSTSYVIFSASGSFFLPFLITTFLYIRIFVVLRRRMRKMRGSTKSHLQRRAKQEAKQSNKNTPKAINPVIIKPKPDIELSQVPNQKSTSGETEASSSKSYLAVSTDSGPDHEEAESAQNKIDHPLYLSSSEPEASTKLIRNGIKERKHEKDKDTLVILNPQHRFSDSEKDSSDKDHIQIVITEDNTATTGLTLDTDQENGNTPGVKNNMVQLISPTLEVPPEGEVVVKKKGFKGMFSKAIPFREKQQKIRTSQRKRYDQREVRATIRMAIIIACFCGCWLGFFVMYVVRAWCTTCYISRQLEAFIFWLGYSNSSMNPILYAIFNEEFRRAFQKLLGCYKRKNMGLRHW